MAVDFFHYFTHELAPPSTESLIKTKEKRTDDLTSKWSSLPALFARKSKFRCKQNELYLNLKMRRDSGQRSDHRPPPNEVHFLH
eukprot:scaffold1812_cov181-Alexandrium_tamarense.AAC.14